MRSNASTIVKTYSCGYPRDLGCPSAMRLPVCFNYKHNDGGTASGCSIDLVMSLLVSLIMEAIAE